MAEYVDIEAAKQMRGLRLVLTAGLPGAPWTEAAKAVFEVKKIPFARVAQRPGVTDAALREWTGHANAPVAMYDDERARPGWLEILHLAERLAPTPRLIPRSSRDRVLMFGLANELMSEDGLVWCRRLMMFDQMDREQRFRETARPRLRLYTGRCETRAAADARRTRAVRRAVARAARARQAISGRRRAVGGRSLLGHDGGDRCAAAHTMPVRCPMDCGRRTRVHPRTSAQRSIRRCSNIATSSTAVSDAADRHLNTVIRK